MEGNRRIPTTSMNVIDHAQSIMTTRAQHNHAVRSCYQFVKGILDGLPPAMQARFSLDQFLAANTFLNDDGQREPAQPWPLGRGDGPPIRQGLAEAETTILDPDSPHYSENKRHHDRQLAFIRGKKFVHNSGRMIPQVSRRYQSSFDITMEVDQLGPSPSSLFICYRISLCSPATLDATKRKAPKDGLPSGRKRPKLSEAEGM